MRSTIVVITDLPSGIRMCVRSIVPAFAVFIRESVVAHSKSRIGPGGESTEATKLPRVCIMACVFFFSAPIAVLFLVVLAHLQRRCLEPDMRE